MKKIYWFFGASMVEQQKAMKGIGISVIIVAAALFLVLNGCSTDSTPSKEYRFVSTIGSLEDIPLEKHNPAEDISWESEIEEYAQKKPVDGFVYTKDAETRETNVVFAYMFRHPEDLILYQHINDGKIKIRIWSNGDLKRVTMKK